MSNLQNNIASLEALITKANALPEEKTIQSSKTVTPSTSSQTVKPDSGYDGMGQVVVNAMPTATQATPSVSIDSAGKITATATQSAGYVAAGTKTGTKQLTTQAAKTITPTKSSQTAVAKNVYTTGAVTVAAIPDKYQDVSNVTATSERTAAGDVFIDKNGTQQTGTLNVSSVFLRSADSSLELTGAWIDTVTGTPSLHIYEPDLGTAERSQVLTGTTFSNYQRFKTKGTMPNNGDTSQTIDGINTTSVTIPKGYTTGGTIALDSTINNTASAQATTISEIAALLDGKSVPGGGGASGGGAQAARGVITLADNILTPNTLIANITGLGFAPKYVLIVGRATKYTLINTSISGKYRRVIYLCEHDGTTNYSGYVYQQYISATNTDGTYGKIVLNSDGFSFYTGTNSESAAYASFEYHYVAIG